ncbi:MAG: hypothetical protein PWQ25_729 [Deferribacteres bacterium]|jgi:hypothetical protein|nr:hypothetical protein [Deferribacteraceae bacterium]MDK2791866.1 hypothetical protein [Deferribacteres bacterium]
MNNNLDIIYGNFVKIAEKILNCDSDYLGEYIEIYQNFFTQINQIAVKLNEISEEDLEKLKNVLEINKKVEILLGQKKTELQEKIIKENKKESIKKKYCRTNNHLGINKET